MDSRALIAAVEQAAAAGQISASAVPNISAWLTEPRYAEYAPEVAKHVAEENWQTLDDVFWTIIPFGTGGRRGRMYPIGSNAINDRTIGESAQGLADYVKSQLGEAADLSCALAYDTRHRSEHFARLCAEIMVANGFRVYFLQGHRSTPELSFCVRLKECSCGIMVTASHNPPSDNAVKAYWSTGGQLLPPHDTGVIDRVMTVETIKRASFDEALANGRVVVCQDEVDAAYVSAVVALASAGPRDVKVLYSPLHGVGATAVCPVLERAGFHDVEVFAPHAEPNGDFPNVPGHVSNPENPKVFDAMIAHASHHGQDLCLATDPDCDRIGLAAPLSFAPGAKWRTLSGNQIGALLGDFILENRKRAGTLGPDNFVVTTLVTTQLLRRIGDSYGVQTFGDNLVGFKWIAGVIDDQGADKFVYGTEESHGYMAGRHNRDKDGGVGALLACELAAQLKAQGQTLHEKLDALFWQHGCHAERTVSVQMPGSEGMARMKDVMAAFRASPPTALAGSQVTRLRDYEQQLVLLPGGGASPLAGPRGDLVIIDLALTGNYVAIRPSGTEPKIKLYMFAYEPAEQLHNLDETKQDLESRLDAMEADLRTFAGV
ncbi:MAG: phospho-sugar mutase [Pirellulales bacterium]|nr:phospho-sugar mutase [Pirellulales bacterium]